jgi:1-aminocyclopropane-1-carboxylate deaminase/D-cysteine desulfhydrase-like pyridoxal-dependent ACC family enzyme
MSWAMVGMAAVSVVGGIIQGKKASKAQASADQEIRRREAQLKAFERNRQKVTNPYAGVTDLGSMITDLSSIMSNPFANLGVATQAAEIQMEETDIALANTLDTLQATGASAGGATALAQAAARSKKDVAASIETQEAENEKAKARGEQNLQAQQLAEKQRVQESKTDATGRFQDAQAKGAEFVFDAQENRDEITMDRIAGRQDQARQNAAQANADQNAAIAGMISGVSSGIAAGVGNNFGNDFVDNSDDFTYDDASMGGTQS